MKNSGKKILYITTVGSTMGFFRVLIRQLLDMGCTVDLAVNELDGKAAVPACYRDWGCRVFPLSCSRSPFDRGNILAVRQIRELAEREGYDLVHCHTPIASACTRIACRRLRQKGLQVFYSAHGFHFYRGAPLKNWLVFYPVEWLCAHWTDTLITTNQEDFARAGRHMHARRVVFVPGVGLSVERFAGAQVDRVAKRRELGVPEDALLLLSVGELNENKNHSVVIRALAQLKDERLHYAIAGSGPLADTLDALADELGLRGRVHLLGRREDVDEICKCADIFVFPSIREGLGMAALEAMASGLPVIASDNRGTRDFLVHGKNGLVCPHDDAAAFSREIDRLSHDSECRRLLGQSNRELVKGFDYAVVNQMILRLYGLVNETAKEQV